jgi:ribosomal protein S18 acetylase RimI-like enzyme
MSEFYRIRRSRISDGLALLGFVLGFIVPAYDAAQDLVTGFENPGQETLGLTSFVVRILLNALAGGAIGFVAGLLIGWIWERTHKVFRRKGPDYVDAATINAVVEPAAESSGAGMLSARSSAAAPAERLDAADAKQPDARIRFATGDPGAEEFLHLVRKVIPGDYDAQRAAAALERTVNVCAWDAGRLVGVVRVLTDGYLYSTIPEIIVDPEYRRGGIGRELMKRALDNSPTGVMLLGSPPEAAGFFERLGCQRAPSGYVLRRRKAPAVTVR